MSQTTDCAQHPGVSTNLSCSRCDTPVCPRCLVHAAVGIRCRECGKGTVPPTYRVDASGLVLAVVTAVVLGLVGGLALSIVVRPLGDVLHLGALAGLGFGLSEAVGLAAGRKRGTRLQVVAAAGVVLAALISAAISLATLGYWSLFDLLAAALAVYVAWIRLR